MNLRAGISNSYNSMVWNSQKYTTSFSVNEGKYVD